MNYAEYKKQEQEEYNNLPIFFAFGWDQFKKAMAERGLTENDTDKIYSIGNGGYYLKTDAEIIREFFNRKDELPELMQNKEFATDAFLYEIKNHEYCYNWEGDYDVCRCFGKCEFSEEKTYKDYLKEAGYDDEVIKCFKAALSKYNKWCMENDIY